MVTHHTLLAHYFVYQVVTMDVYNSNLCVFIVCSLIHKPRKPVTRSKKLLHQHLISLIVFCFCNALQEKNAQAP